jgi:hypothetical protein
MSFTVNGKQINLSPNDTIQVLKGKIASKLETIPSLIEYDLPDIKNGENYTLKNPIFFIDNGDKIRIRKENDVPITLEQIMNIQTIGGLDPLFLKNLYIIAIVQNNIEDFGKGNETIAIDYTFLSLKEELRQKDIWINKKITIEKFKDMVKENVKNVEEQTKTLNLWNDIKPSFESTTFLMNKVNHQTEIQNVPIKNEFMVFDAIKLTKNVVACFYLDMIKYNPDFSNLINEYLKQDNLYSKKLKASNIIRVMVYNEQTVKRGEKKYKMINIFVTEKVVSFSIITLVNESNNLLDNLRLVIKNIITDVVQMYDQTQQLSTKETEYYYGSFVSKVNISILVLKDLVTNDPTLYNICYINESASINTRKSHLNIFLKSNESLGLKVNIAITLFEKSDSSGTLIKLKKIPGDTNFSSKIKLCSSIINKILQYSIVKSEAVLRFYKKYVSVKEIQPLIEIEKQNALKNKTSQLFIANYTKLCSKPPTIDRNVNLDDQIEGCGETYLKFPIYEETEPEIYKCIYPEHKYPGLRSNKLENKNIFPFIPCCYKKPQENSKNCKVYFDQETLNQRINAGEIAKTLKILTPKRQGVLPPKIDKILQYTTNMKFYRYGTSISPNSCLEVLNMVTNNKNSFKYIRSQIASRIELCKGSFKFSEFKEIKSKIVTDTYYINPRYFKNALEHYYKISFILFSKDKDDFSSNSISSFCSFKSKIILMIEHEQEEHVELVVDEETLNYVNKQTKQPIFTFDTSQEITQNIISIYKERFKHNIYPISIDEKQQPNLDIWLKNDKVKLLNQYVDTYGNVRLVEFQHENLNFVGEFDPTPCVSAIETFKPLTYFKDINSRLSPSDVKFIQQKFTFIKLYSGSSGIGALRYHNYKEVKKLANYILWLACHVYSNIFFENKISVDEWILNNTIIVENFTYSGVVVKPIFDPNGIMIKNKFVFNSIELQERIRFNLSLISTVNLKVYKSHYYHNFYNDITNFNLVYPAQLALTKEEYFQKTRKTYTLHFLSSDHLAYIQPHNLYLIKDLFGVPQLKNQLCLFHLSMDELIESVNSLLFKFEPEETKMNFILFNQEKEVKNYVIGKKEPSINIVLLNINNYWHYGLLLPSFK